jgi:hypothetical protein
MSASGKFKVFSVVLAGLASALLSACAGYKPGNGSAEMRSVFVAPVVNQSYLPGIGTALAEKMRDSLLSDNSLRLARKSGAEAVLEITVTNVERLGRASGLVVRNAEDVNGVKVVEQKEDRGLDKAYDITVTAHAVLTDTASGQVLLDKSYDASSQALPDPYLLTNADQEAALLPLLARDIARRIRDDLAQGWR